jgi:DNA-binding transcriptional LysR family regulator
MKSYPIPMDYCLIVNAFNQTSTLRGAALLLEADPAGLVRKCQQISADYGFLQKIGNRWVVTESGRKVALWTDQVINEQKKLLDEKPRLRISAFTWLAEEMMIPKFSLLNKSAGSKYSWSYKTIAADLEAELLQGRSDFVITGHAPNDPTIAHKRIASYSWIVVAPFAWKKALSNLDRQGTIQFLQSMPFVRHSKMNPEQMLEFKPENVANLIVDGVVGLRSAVVNEIGWSVLPAMSIQSFLVEKKLIKINLSAHVRDDVSVWWLRARKDLVSSTKFVISWISEFQVE